MMTVRHALDSDDLDALFPEASGRRLNRDQVFLAEDATGRLLAGALVFHGGHDLAVVGAVRFLTPDRREWAVKALWRAITDWAKAQGIVELMHSAGSRECAIAFERLGARAVRRDDVVLGLRLDEARRDHSAEDEPVSGDALRFRFVSPFDDDDQMRLHRLITTTGAIVQDRPWPWNFVLPTLGVWDRDRLVGYVQFSVSLWHTVDFGLRVHPDYRSHGLGSRLFALWLRLSRRMGSSIAISGAVPGNTAMERLLEKARFQPSVQTSAERLWRGEADTFAWAHDQAEDQVAWP